MRVCLMIEGQEDVTWSQWLRLAHACEGHGFEGLFRSDHYVSVRGQVTNGSLDAWTTLAALGTITSRIRLGTCVSPATFRHPSVLAKSVVTADHTSGGRVELGIGAGWSEIEHTAYGFDFFDAKTRSDRLAEQLEVIHGQWTQESFSFDGEHYRLKDLHGLPKPVQQPHPPIVVGGRAGPRSAALAAKYGDEYNTTSAAPDKCRRRKQRVADAFEKQGRDASGLTFSLMTGCVVGANRTELDARIASLLRRTGSSSTPEAWVAEEGEAKLIGTVGEVVDKLGALQEAGVDRVMLQHLDHSDLDMVALIGEEIVPAVA